MPNSGMDLGGEGLERSERLVPGDDAPAPNRIVGVTSSSAHHCSVAGWPKTWKS